MGANVTIEDISAIYNARTWSRFALLKEATTNATLAAPGVLTGMRTFITNSIPNNLTQGTSSLASDAYVGDFSNVLIGMRTNFRLEVSRQAADAASSAFTNLQVWVRAYLRADIQLAHPEAFVAIVGIL